MLKLRPYQHDAIAGIDALLAAGVNRPAVVQATGLGKTTVFTHKVTSHLADHPRERGLVLVRQDHLAAQARNRIQQHAPHLRPGIVMGAQREHDRPVVVASIQTLSRSRTRDGIKSWPRRDQIHGIGITIYDECFPAGTLVGGVDISTLVPGDIVPSWDENTGKQTKRAVVRVMQRVPSSLVKVTLDDGTSVMCTPDHPFMTLNGWQPARQLRGEVVVSFRHATATDSVHRVRDTDNSDNKNKSRQSQKKWAGVLLRQLSGYLGISGRFRSNVPHEPKARIGADENEQPYVPGRYAFKDGRDLKKNKAPSPFSRWKRSPDAGTSAKVSVVPGVAYGRNFRSKGRNTSLPLQNGYSASDNEGVCRSGRWESSTAVSSSFRSEPGFQTTGSGVVDVEILESGSDGTYGGLCPDGLVYNIEVAGTHTYLIDDGIIVHNCHHAVADTDRAVLEHFGAFDGVPTIGFTATMSREDNRGLGEIWEKVVPRPDGGVWDTEWGIRNGWLCDVRGIRVQVPELDLSGVRVRAGDFDANQTADAMLDANTGAAIVKAIYEFAPERRGVVFAPNVESAVSFAQDMNDAGIPTGVILGSTPKHERTQIYRQFQSGELRWLSNVMVNTEGWDAPWCDAILIARKTKSKGLYQQIVGRGLRTFAGKQDCLVMDVCGVTELHGLASLTDLLFDRKIVPKENQSLLEAMDEQDFNDPDLTGPGWQPVSVPVHQVVGTEIDLFGNSHSVWLQTKRGTWFVPAADRLYFLWPQDDGRFTLGHTAKIRAEKAIPMQADLDLDIGMALAEQATAEYAPDVVGKNAPWRQKGAVRTGQKRDLEAWGIPYRRTMSAAQAYDALNVAMASTRLDVH